MSNSARASSSLGQPAGEADSYMGGDELRPADMDGDSDGGGGYNFGDAGDMGDDDDAGYGPSHGQGELLKHVLPSFLEVRISCGHTWLLCNTDISTWGCLADIEGASLHSTPVVNCCDQDGAQCQLCKQGG